MKRPQHLVILISLLVLPAVSFAATDDFIAGSDITVANVTFGAGTADMLILNGSTAESWTFDSGAFTATNPGTFKVGSSDSIVKSIQVTQSGSTLVCSENSTPGTSFATLPTSSGTYTIVPSATVTCTSLCSAVSNSASLNSFPTCGAASCSAGYRLSGSGASATCVSVGGGGIFYGTLPNVTKPRPQTIYPDGTIVYHDEEIEETPVMPIIEVKQPSIAISALFVKTLRKGMQNDDIKRLQELLASDSSIYPEGLITGYFGQLTENAVQRFQVKYNLVSSGTPRTTGYGLVGPKTRLKLQEIFGDITTTPAQIVAKPSEKAITVSPVFNTSLTKGIFSPDVKRLQQLLNSDPDTQLTSTGDGSPGNETTYFGSLTQKAVQKFQAKYDIVSSGSPETTGYGRVGPKTAAKLKEMFRE
jgi:peptidoglycan hydrolase-like protein with peptidoglycan-binding domain